MTGIHYDDLTQIHTAFGLLDVDTRTRLRACERVEAYLREKWVYLPNPNWHADFVYRQAPQKRAGIWQLIG